VEYDPSRFHSADEVAELIGVPVAQVFKTIVVVRDGGPATGSRPNKHPILVIVPAHREEDLKKLAAGLREKKLWVAPQKDAEALTKLQVGGISALALINRGFDVVLDRSAERFAEAGIYVSGGQRGLNVRIKPADLASLAGARWLDASTT